MLVGVDDHSDFPADVVGSLPRVGPDLGIDVNKVAGLKPDLVLGSLTVPGHEKIVAALEASGLNYHAPEPVSLDDVYRDVVEIADLLDVPSKGQAVCDDMRQHIQANISPTSDHVPTILVQWWPKPVITPGKKSWVTDVLVAAGAVNPLAERDVKSTPLEDTEVLALDPDAVVISWCGVRPEKYRPEVVYRNEQWQQMNAIVNRHVYCVPEAYLGRPSPRLVQGCEALRNIVRALSEIPIR